MPQTMLGLLALAIATMLAMTQQQNAVDNQLDRIRNELSVHSTTVAEDVLQLIGTMAFDQATTDPDAPDLTSPWQLTLPADFGPDEGEANDIDDFHGSIGQQYKQRLIRRDDPATGTVRVDTLRFEVDVRVAYVNENDLYTEITTPSKAKKAEVTVFSTTISRPDTIRLSRSFVCGTRCAW